MTIVLWAPGEDRRHRRLGNAAYALSKIRLVTLSSWNGRPLARSRQIRRGLVSLFYLCPASERVPVEGPRDRAPPVEVRIAALQWLSRGARSAASDRSSTARTPPLPFPDRRWSTERDGFERWLSPVCFEAPEVMPERQVVLVPVANRASPHATHSTL